MCLLTLEERAGMQCSEFFDMIAGTSVGAIIAGLLASGKSAGEVFSLFKERTPVYWRSR
jgi:uncharacterized protein